MREKETLRHVREWKFRDYISLGIRMGSYLKQYRFLKCWSSTIWISPLASPKNIKYLSTRNFYRTLKREGKKSTTKINIQVYKEMQKENIKLYMTIHIHNRSKINEQIDGRNVKEKKKFLAHNTLIIIYIHFISSSKKKNQRRSDEEKAKKEKLPNIIFTNHFEDCWEPICTRSKTEE